jgi:hypothetical protein
MENAALLHAPVHNAIDGIITIDDLNYRKYKPFSL